MLRVLVIDNASSADLALALENEGVEYIAPAANVGFGRAHNLALEQLQKSSVYHMFVNPDIQVFPGTVASIVDFMDSNPDVGAVMPKVVYPDRRIQRQCKLLPSPIDLVLRRFAPKPVQRTFADMMLRYDLAHMDYERAMEPPVVSGCFLTVRTSVIHQTGGFDPKFFLYLEDFDLCRRIRQYARLVYFPGAIVVHEHARGSYKSFRLLSHHVASAIRYFNKWGWFRDHERSALNRDEAINGNVWSLDLSAISATKDSLPQRSGQLERVEDVKEVSVAK